jgi:NitT/TauT family transport system permease protein
MAINTGWRRAALEYMQTGLTLAAVLITWEIVCDVWHVPSWLLPAPSRIVVETWDIRQILPLHFAITLSEVIGGFFLAILAGVPLAIMVVYSRVLRRIIYPVLLMLQSVPKVALAPLLLIWVGYGLTSNMAVAAMVAFFPIVINTATGLESVDSELLDLTSSFESSKFKVFWKVRLPWSLPYIFSSLKVAITLSVIGAIVAEFIGADRGLGYLMLTSSGAMKTSLMFGVLVLLSLLGIICFYAVCGAERLICPWYLPTENDVTRL